MPETQSTSRLRWLLRILLVWVAAIFARLVWLQVIHHDDLLAQAQRAKKLEESNKALGAQAARARELDLQVKTLRTQLDQKTQQLKRLGSQNPDQ